MVVIIETRVTKMLGIEYPIIMGGMTGVGTPELAAAVSNSGGLGIFAAHNAGSPEQCRIWIRTIRTKLLNNPNVPFGVNLTILPTVGTPPPYKEYAKVFIEENVPIVETAGNNPKEYIQMFKEAGIITIHKCVSIKHAKSAEKIGVDIISLDGFECAGHPGESGVGNFVLQAVGGQVLNIPYVCSGGVGNGQQLAAALALGADGINCGTRFCITKESNWPISYKQRILHSNEEDTVLMLYRLRNTTRVYANKIAKQVQAIEYDKGKDFKFTDVAELVSGKRGRQAEKDNNPDDGIWSAGQVIGLINDIPTVDELIQSIMKECYDTIQNRLQKLLIVPQSKL